MIVKAAQDLKKEFCREIEEAFGVGCCRGRRRDAPGFHRRGVY